MADRSMNNEVNARRIAFVESCFGSSGQPLMIPNRLLVGEGVLTKVCRKKPKPRQFFLFNDILVYGNIVINKKKYNKQHIMQLEDMKLLPVDDDESLCNGWQIISPSKSFAVYAATLSEKTEWMAHINRCVHDLLTKHGRKSISADPSPVWVPDSGATTCMCCRKSEFNLVNRRHHCRKCGIVCCGACASQRWLLPHQSAKPLRVCLGCYKKLSSSTASEDAIPSSSATSEADAVQSTELAESVEISAVNDRNNGSSGEESSDSETETNNGGLQDNQPTFYAGQNSAPSAS